MLDERDIVAIKKANRDVRRWLQGLECYCDAEDRCGKRVLLSQLELSDIAISHIESESIVKENLTAKVENEAASSTLSKEEREMNSNGGPAFPQTLIDYGRGLEIADNYGMGGMSLRDYFAGQALAGWLASFGEDQGPKKPYTDIAEFAYEVADAMINKRRYSD